MALGDLSMALSAHLSYLGQCEEAFNFYAELFGGQLMMLAYRDTPMAQEVPAEWREKIVHATLSFNGCTLAGSDVQLAHYRRPQGFSVLADVEGVDNANRIFSALAERGRVEMPMQETFWSPVFGVLVDRFDIPWEINGVSSDPAK
jgi:PhnB protein